MDPAGRWELFELNEQGRPSVLQVNPSCLTLLVEWVTARAPSDDGSAPAPEFAVLVLSRPWLSMRKYGPRGYLYTQLDAGHAATNLLGVALERGPAELRIAPHDELLSRNLDWCFPRHELHSAVLVRGGSGDRRGQRVAVRPSLGVRADPRFDVEARLWHDVVERMRARGVHGVRAGSTSAVVDLGPRLPAGDHLIEGWSRWSRLRRSAKGFGTDRLAAEDLLQVLAGTATPLPTDVRAPGERPALAARLVLAPDVSDEVLDTLSPFAVRRMDDGTRPADIVAACMGQQHVSNAQAFLVLHARRADLLPAEGAHRLQAVLFCAGATAQLTYLGAARADIGAFTIGGFGQAEWRRHAGLDAADDVVCIIALGAKAAAAGPRERLDRLEPPLAHGAR